MIETSLIIAVIIGLVQAVKQFGLKSKHAPLLAVLFGVVAAFGVAQEATLGLTVFNGIVLGLSSAGLYSGTRAVVSK